MEDGQNPTLIDSFNKANHLVNQLTGEQEDVQVITSSSAKANEVMGGTFDANDAYNVRAQIDPMKINVGDIFMVPAPGQGPDGRGRGDAPPRARHQRGGARIGPPEHGHHGGQPG